MTIMAHFQVFDICQVEYWKDAAHSFVTVETENSNINVLFCFIS